MLAGVLSLVLAGDASAATTEIGQAQGTQSCGTNFSFFQISGTPSYTVPTGGGVVTSWSTQAGPNPGTAALEIWRPTSTAGTFTLIARSPAEALSPNTVNTFSLATPIPVQAGDTLGLRTVSGSVVCQLITGNNNDVAANSGLFNNNVAVGDTLRVFVFRGRLINVAAVVRPASPTSVGECKNSGWEQLTDDQGGQFKNQGDCVSFVASQGRNAGNA